MENKEKYYTAEDYEELSHQLFLATDAMKYLLNIPKDNPDSKYRTEELMEELENVAGSCEDFLSAYKYYTLAKNYECANNEEMHQHIQKTAKSIARSLQNKL